MPIVLETVQENTGSPDISVYELLELLTFLSIAKQYIHGRGVYVGERGSLFISALTYQVSEVDPDVKKWARLIFCELSGKQGLQRRRLAIDIIVMWSEYIMTRDFTVSSMSLL